MEPIEGGGGSGPVTRGGQVGGREEALRRLEDELRRIQREMEEARRRAEQARQESELQAARAALQRLQERLQQLSRDVSRLPSQGQGGAGREGGRLRDLREEIASAQAAARASLRALDQVSVVAAPASPPARFLKDDLAVTPALPEGPTYRVDPNSGRLVPSVPLASEPVRDRWYLEEPSPPGATPTASVGHASAQATALYAALDRKVGAGGRGGGAVASPDLAAAEQVLRGLGTDAERTALVQAFQEQYGTTVSAFIVSRVPAGERRVALLTLVQTASAPATGGLLPEEKAIEIAGQLNQAMDKGLGTDERRIFDALRGLSSEEARQVAYQYEVHYNLAFDPGGTPLAGFRVENSLLYSHLQGELDENPNDWARAQALLRGDTAAADAIALRASAEKPPLFRSGDEILNVLRNAPPEQRIAIIQAFAEDYAQRMHSVGGGMGGPLLVRGTDMPQYDPDPTVLMANVLRGTLGATEFAEAQSLIAGALQYDNTAAVASTQGAAVESRLTNLLDRWIPDGAGALQVLRSLTPEEQQYLQSLAPAGGGSSRLEQLIRSKLSPSDFQQATAYLHGDAASAQATALHEALTRVAHGRGGSVPTPDVAAAEQILRGLQTDDERMALLAAFETQYHVNLASLISRLPAGANRDILTALAQSSPEVLAAPGTAAPGLSSEAWGSNLELRADELRRATQRLMGVDEAAVREAFAGLTAEQARALAAMPLDPSNPGGRTLKDELTQWYRAGSGRFGLELTQMLDGDAAATGDVQQEIDEAQAQYAFETDGPGAAINEGLQGLFGGEARAVLDVDAARLQAAENALAARPAEARAQTTSHTALAYMEVGQTDYENAKDLTAEVAKTTATAAAVVVTTAATGGTAAAAWAPVLAGATASVAATQLRGNANSWEDNIVAGLEGAASGIVIPGTAVATEGGQFVVREVVTVGGQEVLRDVPLTLAREIAEQALAQGGKEVLEIGGRRFTVAAFEQTLGQALQQNVTEAVVGSVVGDVTAGTVRGDLRGEQVLQNAAVSALTAGAVTFAMEGAQAVLHSARGQAPELADAAPEASPTQLVPGSPPGNEVPPGIALEADDAGRNVTATAIASDVPTAPAEPARELSPAASTSPVDFERFRALYPPGKLPASALDVERTLSEAFSSAQWGELALPGQKTVLVRLGEVPPFASGITPKMQQAVAEGVGRFEEATGIEIESVAFREVAPQSDFWHTVSLSDPEIPAYPTKPAGALNLSGPSGEALSAEEAVVTTYELGLGGHRLPDGSIAEQLELSPSKWVNLGDLPPAALENLPGAVDAVETRLSVTKIVLPDGEARYVLPGEKIPDLPEGSMITEGTEVDVVRLNWEDGRVGFVPPDGSVHLRQKIVGDLDPTAFWKSDGTPLSNSETILLGDYINKAYGSRLINHGSDIIGVNSDFIEKKYSLLTAYADRPVFIFGSNGGYVGEALFGDLITALPKPTALDLDEAAAMIAEQTRLINEGFDQGQVWARMLETARRHEIPIPESRFDLRGLPWEAWESGTPLPSDVIAELRKGVTQPSFPPDPSRVAPGSVRIDPNLDAAGQARLLKQERTGNLLAQLGYDVEHLPNVPGRRGGDFLVEGRVFDAYAPDTTNANSIWDEVKKKVLEGQADRIILNLEGNAADLGALRAAFANYPIRGLQELLVVVDGGGVAHLWP